MSSPTQENLVKEYVDILGSRVQDTT